MHGCPRTLHAESLCIACPVLPCRTCDDDTCSSRKLGDRPGKPGNGSSWVTSSHRLPEAPARETLLAVLKAVPASAGVLIALLEQHQGILSKPKLFAEVRFGGAAQGF